MRAKAPTVLAVLLAGVCLLPVSVSAEMYQYRDSKGRLHFTQDIGQIPPQYRDQVERRELRRDISVTGKPSEAGRDDAARIRAMKNRSRRLERSATQRKRQMAVPAKVRQRRNANPLQGAREPKKYNKDCSDYHRTGRCRKTLTHEWRAWDRANGGNNGKPDIRRKINRR